MELWNVAVRMKETAEILQGAAWIGTGIGICLGMRLLKQWKKRKKNRMFAVLMMGLTFSWLIGNGMVTHASESGDLNEMYSTIQMERIDSTASVCRDHLEIYLRITDNLSGIKNIRLWQNNILILDECVSSDSTGEGVMQKITQWEKSIQLLIEYEGTVELRVEMEDMTGNVSQKVKYWEADFTGPVVTAEWRGIQNQGCFQGNGTLVLHLKEKNFQPDNCQILWKEYPVTFQTGAAWVQTEADEYEAEILFAQDGAYELEINGTDFAGNSLTFENQKGSGRIRWEVDGTKPDIIIEGIQDGGAYNSIIQMNIRLSDRNLVQNQSEVKLEGNKNGMIELIQVQQEKEMQYCWEPSMDAGVDDVYHLYIQAVDQAGNISEKEIHFWINRSGSQYHLEGLEEDGSYAGTRQIILEETNLNKVEIYTLMYVRDGDTRILEEGMDYIRNVREEENGMHYQYMLEMELFAREGLYTVTLLTEDEAGNKMSNLQNAYENLPINFRVERPRKRQDPEKEWQRTEKKADIRKDGITDSVKKCLYVIYFTIYLLQKMLVY